MAGRRQPLFGSGTLGLVHARLDSSGAPASKRVKVIFKAPSAGVPSAHDLTYTDRYGTKYIIKDLDDDILAGTKTDTVAQKSAIFSTTAHREVSLVIQTVRGQGQVLTKLNQLLFAMKHRHTSWNRDRMIITSLMADPQGFDAKLTAADITRKLLAEHIIKITPGSLLHGKATMCTSGPWSWCPRLLLDLEEDEEGYDSFVAVTPKGELEGTWKTRTLSEAEMARLQPVASHPSVVMRTKLYQAKPGDVLLLDKQFAVRVQRHEHDSRGLSDRYLLVGKPDAAGRSRYIGTVSGIVDWSGGGIVQHFTVG